MRKPLFSVLLTTYARPDTLKLAIKSVLNQDFYDFELLILDDNSPDNTEEIVRSYKNKRITYVKNKKNLGFAKNFKKGVRTAKGKYIFLLSDDDLILENNTLSIISKELKKRSVDFCQLGLIFYDKDINKPFMRASPLIDKTVYFPLTEDIFIKTIDWHFGFASGNIYKKSLIKTKDIVDDIWFSHVKPIYRLMKKSGALYIGKNHILGKISQSGNVAYLNVKTNKVFHMKKMFKLFAEFNKSKKINQLFVKKHLEEGAIGNFAGIKYYTSNKNVWLIARELLRLSPNYKYNVGFWINLFMSVLIPKFIWGYLRKIKVVFGQRQMKNYLKKISYRKHLSRIMIQ